MSGEVDGSRLPRRRRRHGDRTRRCGTASRCPRASCGRPRCIGDACSSSCFASPQDVEWAIVDGELDGAAEPTGHHGDPRGADRTALRSRPRCRDLPPTPGPLGAGPVGLTSAQRCPRGTAALRHGVGGRPEESDLVTVVGGRVAIDLGITGEVEEAAPKHGLGGRIRRLRSAWRIGRLRSALPLIADDLVDAGRRRPRAGSAPRRPHQPPARRPHRPGPRRPREPARPRDPPRTPRRSLVVAVHRRIGGHAGARRSPSRRHRRRRDRPSLPRGPRPRGARGSARRSSCHPMPPHPTW